MRTHVRRRHRTWVASMTLATVGWAVLWTTLLLRRYAPGWAPDWTIAWWIAVVFALPGLGLAIFTVRARLIWVLLAAVPLFANASLIGVRLFLDGDRAGALPESSDARTDDAR
jgi:hypothetical protein